MMDVVFKGPLGDICAKCDHRYLLIADAPLYADGKVCYHSTTVYCEHEKLCASLRNELTEKFDSPHLDG